MNCKLNWNQYYFIYSLLLDSDHSAPQQTSSLDFTISSQSFLAASSTLLAPPGLELPASSHSTTLQLSTGIMHNTYEHAKKWNNLDISEAEYWQSMKGAEPVSSGPILDPGSELCEMCLQATFANPPNFVLKVPTVAKGIALAAKVSTYKFKLRIFPDLSHDTEAFPNFKKYLFTSPEGKQFYEVDFIMRNCLTSFGSLMKRIVKITSFQGTIAEVSCCWTLVLQQVVKVC